RLHQHRDAESGTALVVGAVVRFGEPQDVPTEAGLVESVDGHHVVGARDHTAVLRGPRELSTDTVVAGDTPGERPQIGGGFAVVIHVASHEHLTGRAVPHNSCAHMRHLPAVDPRRRIIDLRESTYSGSHSCVDSQAISRLYHGAV